MSGRFDEKGDLWIEVSGPIPPSVVGSGIAVLKPVLGSGAFTFGGGFNPGSGGVYESVTEINLTKYIQQLMGKRE